MKEYFAIESHSLHELQRKMNIAEYGWRVVALAHAVSGAYGAYTAVLEREVPSAP